MRSNLFKKYESGRSMIEMLGVLAIMGVLSLTALYGYRHFVNKQRADALLNDVNLQATNFSSELVKAPPSTELTPLDTSHFPKNSGYEFQAATLQDQFYIQTAGIPQEICELMMRAQYEVPFQVDVNAHRNVNGDEDACDQDENTVVFHYKNDLEGCVGKECEAMEVCKEGEVYCGLKCYKEDTHACLYPNNEICQRDPFPGLDRSPICQVGPDSYTCCTGGSFCRLDSKTAPYYMCAKCEEDEKLMPDDSCCAKSDLCGDVCCSNSNYVCKENKYCVREDQWCENTACASDQRCTSVGCCKVYKACQDDTKCCEEGEVCSLDNVCCPEEQESALKCCASGEVGYHNLCCDKASTTPMTSLGLDICCPKDRVCTDSHGRKVCSKYDNAANGGVCEAVDCAAGQQLCNLQCYDPNVYECINNNTLCKTQGAGATHLNCGGSCCDTTNSTCINGSACCPKERVLGEGETAGCCAPGTVAVNGACCGESHRCVVDGEELCCPEGNCCQVSPGVYSCCAAGTSCLATDTPGERSCMVPTTCESNDDCPDGKFCKTANNVLYDAAEKKGTCTALSKNTQTLELDGRQVTMVRSDNGAMNRWSAENFCSKMGMKLVTDQVTCPGGNLKNMASGTAPDCNSFTMQQVIGSKFGSGMTIHVRKGENNVAYVHRLSQLHTTEQGIISYGATQTGTALCMPLDFAESWTCPTTRPYYTPKFKTCVARICSADENGTVVDECPNNEYCHYDTNWTSGSCSNRISHTGVCRPINEVTADLEFSVSADGNTTTHTWKQSTISMPWLSAEDLCHKLGRQVVTRTQLCGLNSGLGSAPCSEAATYRAVQPKVNRSFWMEELSACTAYRHLNGSFESIDKASTSNDIGAVCSDLTYADPCGATKIFNKDSQSCDQICRVNEDCVVGKYCDLITFTTDNGCYFESGVCRSVVTDRRDYTIAYDDGDHYMTEDWVTSTRQMSWDSAKNFCAAMYRPIVSREEFLNANKCTTSTRCMTAREIIDNSSSTWWFDDQPVASDTCKAYQARSSDLGRDVAPSGASRKEKKTALCGPYNQLSQPCECYDGTCENSCLPKNGMCAYDISIPSASDMVKSTNCSYQISIPAASSLIKSANCSYDLAVTSTGATVTARQSCTSTDEYCYVAYTDSGCSTSIPANANNITLYGNCVKYNSNSTQCTLSMPANTGVTVTPVQSCTSADEYCYVAYADSSCSTSLSASANNTTFYGNCVKYNSNSTQCTLSPPAGGGVTVTEQIGCPINKYCYVNWTEQNCSATAAASSQGRFYGTCLNWNQNSPPCVF